MVTNIAVFDRRIPSFCFSVKEKEECACESKQQSVRRARGPIERLGAVNSSRSGLETACGRRYREDGSTGFRKIDSENAAHGIVRKKGSGHEEPLLDSCVLG